MTDMERIVAFKQALDNMLYEVTEENIQKFVMSSIVVFIDAADRSITGADVKDAIAASYAIYEDEMNS